MTAEENDNNDYDDDDDSDGGASEDVNEGSNDDICEEVQTSDILCTTRTGKDMERTISVLLILLNKP